MLSNIKGEQSPVAIYLWRLLRHTNYRIQRAKMGIQTDFPVLDSFFSLPFPFKIASLLVVGIAFRLLWNRFRKELRDIPGPKVAAYTGLWRWLDVRAGQAHKNAIKLHKRYGSLVRIGPNHVSVSDPREINHIYGMKSKYTKTEFYHPIQSIIWKGKAEPHLFTMRDLTVHRESKKILANAYSPTSVLAYEPAVDECITLLLYQIEKLAEEKKPIDLGEWMSYYTFDVIGQLSFSKMFGFLEKGCDVDKIIETIDIVLTYASQCGQLPELHKFLLGNPFLPGGAMNQIVDFALKAINGAASRHTSLRKDGVLDALDIESRGDMLTKWYALNQNGSQWMTTKYLVAHLSANVYGGSDTTSIALRSVLYYLGKNRDKMRKLVEEIDGAAAAGNISQPVSFKEANTHLPYLNAVIKEGMRIHPSAGLMYERYVPSGGDTICGKHIPGGTVVGINPWVTQYDPEVFPDPESFVPERWLDSTEEQLKRMEQSFFNFSAGSRTCLGRHIAMIEISKMIPELLRRFELTLTYPDREWETRNVWLVKQKGVICNITKRS
ncbi:cytochrome P450 [Daldinia decipiens]|uniref:cytochrome P450 n=1 Tax=Daldinia decipiens TaxID=326647 RepID=UPI0020C58B37|nr:cytochrome P450 [Daldinia decipiens]KAI1658729.1 cytochrome P450 [Daldinia decipiens]